MLVEKAVVDWPAHSKQRRKDTHGTYGHVKFKIDKEKDVSSHQNRNMTWLSKDSRFVINTQQQGGVSRQTGEQQKRRALDV